MDPVRKAILESESFSNALLPYAKSHKVDLVVMGSRGIGGFKNLLQ